jgi:two-component system, NarL family, nitrate/nitrite response regulator NarL
MASVAVFARSPLFRAGLAALLSAMGFTPVLAVSGLEELKAEADDVARPEMILLSLPQDGERISTLITDLRTWVPAAKIVCLAQTLDIQELSSCFAAGASGYLLQEISRAGLEHSLRLVNAGEKVFPSALASALPPSGAKHSGPGKTMEELRKLHLTDLDIEILRYIAGGDFNGAIAKKSGLSDAEVRTRVRVILRKLHVSNRTQAALWAFARGLAEPFAALPQAEEESNDSEEGREPFMAAKKPNG